MVVLTDLELSGWSAHATEAVHVDNVAIQRYIESNDILIGMHGAPDLCGVRVRPYSYPCLTGTVDPC